MEKIWKESYMRWRSTHTDIDLELVSCVPTQVNDTTGMNELDTLSNRGPIKTDETTSDECWSNPEASVKEDSKVSWQWNWWYDWGGGPIKEYKTPVKNADQTQKNQTREVADNDDSDTFDVMSELEDEYEDEEKYK